MDFGLSEEQEMLQETIRGFAQKECPTTRVRELFYRIKVFNDQGAKYANIEIPYDRRVTRVRDIEARVVQPSGEIMDFAALRPR